MAWAHFRVLYGLPAGTAVRVSMTFDRLQNIRGGTRRRENTLTTTVNPRN